jgi:hypothetical protein
MVAAPTFAVSKNFSPQLDFLLLHVCEELQLPESRYNLAVQRYGTLNTVLENSASPFRAFRPLIYPQGSMALGTTVAPLKGQHDLDFVLQLSCDYFRVQPMPLIRSLYEFLQQNGKYRSMTELKNRCVRITYADDFYMDILPACLNPSGGNKCIKVPDCAVRGWSDSNPKGYIEWFEKKSHTLFVGQMMDKAEPIPDQQAVAEKTTLQLAVQLLKRWRDIHYADQGCEFAPISIVLTTLAGEFYRGDRSVSRALMEILVRTVQLIDESRRRGEPHLRLCNPSNTAEDLTERWDSNTTAYDAFERGIRDFRNRWANVMDRKVNIDSELVLLFGETVTDILRKDRQSTQKARIDGNIGVMSTGIITSAAGRVGSVRPNTFYGE